MRSRTYRELSSQDNGGGDFSLVHFPNNEWADLKPACRIHGAMNMVSPSGLWRCIATAGPKNNPCRAACEEMR